MILALLKRYSSSDGSSCDVLLIMNEAYVEPFVARNGLLIRSALENLARWESFSQKGGRGKRDSLPFKPYYIRWFCWEVYAECWVLSLPYRHVNFQTMYFLFTDKIKDTSSPQVQPQISNAISRAFIRPPFATP